MLTSVIEKNVQAHCPDEDVPEEWDLQAIAEVANASYLPEGELTAKHLENKEKEEMIEYIEDLVESLYDKREQEMGDEVIREFEKVIMLRSVDSKWMDHIDAMDQLRQGIHLRAYGGTDPLREYQFEGYEMFQGMIERIQEEVSQYIMRAQVQQNLERKEVATGQAAMASDGTKAKAPKPVRRVIEKIGRNDICPCGSGKKYKMCCGK
jgi:preprotein translocase subunit SecA